MKTGIKIGLIITVILLASGSSFAKNNNWEKEFVQALQKGKLISTQKKGGLAYTPPESSVLENAIKDALEQDAPACQVMKIAVDLKYNPYTTLTNIFSAGGEIDLNEMCMCATESGINKQIIARAAAQATTPVGTPVFQRDEIAQTQCLLEIGLGYTALASQPEPIDPPDDPKPYSVSAAGQ